MIALVSLSTAMAGHPMDGAWTRGEARVVVDSGIVEMSLRGTLHQKGPTREKGDAVLAAMDGCGATLTTDGAFLRMVLEGPECPMELAGDYTREGPPTSHCEASAPVFRCDIQGKPQVLEVCSTGAEYAYRYGVLGAVELAVEKGASSERPLVSGMQYAWTFTNDGYAYAVWVVESARSQDNGAGVIVTRGEREVARLRCADGYVRSE